MTGGRGIRLACLAALGVRAAPLPAQAVPVLSADAALTQSLPGTQRGWLGPGLRLAYRAPRTPDVDGGIELGAFHAGWRVESFTYRNPAGIDVIRRERELLQYVYAGAVARYHLGTGPLHPMVTGMLGLYGVRRELRFSEETPTGTPVSADTELADGVTLAPGVGAGAGLVWQVGARLRVETELRLHAALDDGFPAVLLSVGLARVLGPLRGGP